MFNSGLKIFNDGEKLPRKLVEENGLSYKISSRQVLAPIYLNLPSPAFSLVFKDYSDNQDGLTDDYSVRVRVAHSLKMLCPFSIVAIPSFH